MIEYSRSIFGGDTSFGFGGDTSLTEKNFVVEEKCPHKVIVL